MKSTLNATTQSAAGAGAVSAEGSARGADAAGRVIDSSPDPIRAEVMARYLLAAA